VQEGQIAVPYTWWVGETGSRFLNALQEKELILANKCPSCGTVYVPPRKNCGKCFVQIEEWLELSGEGAVESFTIVRRCFVMHPFKAPFAYALIRLDGADVSFLHIIKDGIEKIEKGSRVKAVFRKERKGHILDIECFKLV